MNDRDQPSFAYVRFWPYQRRAIDAALDHLTWVLSDREPLQRSARPLGTWLATAISAREPADELAVDVLDGEDPVVVRAAPPAAEPACEVPEPVVDPRHFRTMVPERRHSRLADSGCTAGTFRAASLTIVRLRRDGI
jgi:hypothetical protein